MLTNGFPGWMVGAKLALYDKKKQPLLQLVDRRRKIVSMQKKRMTVCSSLEKFSGEMKEETPLNKSS